MTLIRRIISFLLLALILAGAVYGLVWLRARKLKVLDPVKALPSGVVMFVDTHDFRQLISSVRHHTNIWTEFKAYQAIEQIDNQMAMVDSLGRTYSDFKMLMDGEVIMSVCKTDTGYSTLFILNDRQRKATEQVLKLIPSDSDIDKHREGTVTVYHIDTGNDSMLRKFSFYESYGLFVMSPSGSLLDASVRQLNAEKHLDDNAQFARLKGTTGSDVIANVYVNYQELGPFLKGIFRNDTTGFMSHFAEWSAFDLDLKPDYITLNGFTTAGDSLHQTIRMLHGQEPVAFDLAGVVPSNAVYFSMTGFSDATLLLENVGKYVPDRERTKKLARIATATGEDITTAFSRLMDGEAGTVLLRRSRGDFNRFFLIKVKGTAMAQDVLDAWTKVAAKAKGKVVDDYSEKVNIDGHHQVVVHKSPFTGIPGLLFSRFYHKSDYNYYTYAGNYLVFGPSAEALKAYLYFNLLGKTLENDENYKSLTDNISSRSNLFIYADPSRYREGLEKLLTPEAARVVNSHKDKWRKIDAIAFQSTSTDDLNYFRVFAHYSSQIREQVNTVWESKLDTTALFKPAVVINHTNNQKEIFVQDLKHTIYLISNTGSILWKQKVDGDIISDINQIDFYGNGKLQYLFNTKQRIYLIDRNGNPVDRYPVDMRSPASAGMSLFDYDNDGTLRICIPAENKKIYMYGRDGKIIPGWNFSGSDYPVTHPVKHIRIGDKDYIIACDAAGLYILDRRGRPRVSPARGILHSPENPVYPVAASGGLGPIILATDTSGTVWAFHYDGRVSKVFDPDLSRHHFFVPEDLNGDGRMEYVFADGNKLLVYDGKGKLLFREEYPGPISWPPVIYEFSASDKKIGIVTAETGRIYLVNNDGSLYKGFPLLGVSPFSISSFPGLKDRFNLIVGNNDNFLYNYSVK